MRKFFTLLCATFIASSAWAQTEPAKLETVWDHSVNNGNTKPAYVLVYAWNASQRSMAYYNGKIYIAHNQPTVDYITVVDATTGVLEKQLSLGAAYGGQTGWMKNSISITEDGYAIIGSSGTGGAYMTFNVVDLNTETVVTTGYVVQSPDIVRADYFDVHGKFQATEAEGAFILVAANAGSVVKIPIVAGEIKKDEVTIVASTYASVAAPGTSAQAITNQDGSGVYVVGRTLSTGYHDLTTNTFTAVSETLVPKGSNSGGACFEIAGKKYLVAAIDNISKFTVLDVTDGAASAVEVIKSESELGTHNVATTSAMTPMTVQVLADAAIIYLYSTNNGIAAYKFTPEKAEVKIVEDPVFTPPAGSFEGEVIVTIASATPEAKIYYTIDGTDPTDQSTLYAGPITLKTATTVKAIALLDGYTASAIVSATYGVTSGIDEDGQVVTTVYSQNGVIVVETESIGSLVEVYNLQGQKVATVLASGKDEITAPKGIYIVKVATKVYKVAL